MATVRKANRFHKGGYKKKRTKETSRSGLPKIYPPHINATLKAVKLA